ncbi:MAG TPA: J domain-containing protein [Candidatus Woesebacteria bacterium]|nr:J domain-containing protein [Candidatus Woesebacteria bacterium]
MTQAESQQIQEANALSALENIKPATAEEIAGSVLAIASQLKTLVASGKYPFKPQLDMANEFAALLVKELSSTTPSKDQLSKKSELQVQYWKFLIRIRLTLLYHEYPVLVRYQADIEDKVGAQLHVIDTQLPKNTDKLEELKRLLLFLEKLNPLYTLLQRVDDQVDCWQLLGIERRADASQVHSAFQQLSRVSHPDHLLTAWQPMGTTLFQAINSAQEELSRGTYYPKPQVHQPNEAPAPEQTRKRTLTLNELLRQASREINPRAAISRLVTQLREKTITDEFGFAIDVGTFAPHKDTPASQLVDHPQIKTCLINLEQAVTQYDQFLQAVQSAQTLPEIIGLLSQFDQDRGFYSERGERIVTIFDILQELKKISNQLAELSLLYDYKNPPVVFVSDLVPQYLHTAINRIIAVRVLDVKKNAARYKQILANYYGRALDRVILNAANNHNEYDLATLERIDQLIRQYGCIPLSRIDQTLGITDSELLQPLVEALIADGYVVNFEAIQTIEDLLAILTQIQMTQKLPIPLELNRIIKNLRDVCADAKDGIIKFRSWRGLTRQTVTIKVSELTPEMLTSTVIPFLLGSSTLKYQPFESPHFQRVLTRLIQSSAKTS